MQNCRNRYFLILDEKFIDGLLLLPPSEEYLSPMICLKVFDADFGLPGSYFGKEIKNLNDSGDDEEGDSSDEYNYEGWFAEGETFRSVYLGQGITSSAPRNVTGLLRSSGLITGLGKKVSLLRSCI